MVPRAARDAASERELPTPRTPSPTRTDWRLMLGLSRSDTVFVVGEDFSELAQGLRPWVRDVYGSLDGLEARRDPGEFTATPAPTDAPGAAPAGGTVDWLIFEGSVPADGDVRRAIAKLLPALRPGGRVVVHFDNLWPFGGWHSRRRRNGAGARDGVPCHGLGQALRLLESAGCTGVACYAVLSNRRAPRTLIPVAPPCPPAAEKFALGQASKRAARRRALGRLGLHLLVDLRLLRHLYPHYLVVGRKPC